MLCSHPLIFVGLCNCEVFDAHFMLKSAEFLVVLRFNQDVINYCNVVCVVDFLVKRMFHDFHDLLECKSVDILGVLFLPCT